jgi:hypothetical protein
MFRQLFILAAVLPAVAVQAYAAQPCLRLDQIDTWSVPNDQTVIAENYHHEKFKISLMGSCTGLQFNEALAFKSVGGSQLSCLRGGDYVLRRQEPSRCAISSVEPVPPDQGNAHASKDVH